MDLYQSWDNVIEYVKDHVGGHTQKLEFDDDKIISILNRDVIPLFSKYDKDLVYYRFSAADLINPDSPILEYKFNETFNRKILDVEGKINENSLWDDLNMANFAMSSGDITDYLVMSNYNQIAEMIQPIDSWKFRPPNIFQMIRGNTYRSTDNFILIVNCIHQSPVTMSPDYFDYFKDLSLAKIKILLAENRKKFKSFSTPMGQVELNVDEMKQEGETLWKDTMDSIINTPPDQMAWFF